MFNSIWKMHRSSSYPFLPWIYLLKCMHLFTTPMCKLRKVSSCQLIYLPYSAHVPLSEISSLLRKSQLISKTIWRLVNWKLMSMRMKMQSSHVSVFIVLGNSWQNVLKVWYDIWKSKLLVMKVGMSGYKLNINYKL